MVRSFGEMLLVSRSFPGLNEGTAASPYGPIRLFLNLNPNNLIKFLFYDLHVSSWTSHVIIDEIVAFLVGKTVRFVAGIGAIASKVPLLRA